MLTNPNSDLVSVMSTNNTVFDVAEIEKYAQMPVFAFDEIDSTNSAARRFLEAEADKTGIYEGLFVADFQSAGRGRTGHSFYSPSHTGIYMSYFFTPGEGLENASNATTKAAVVARKVLSDAYGIDVGIKWINDLYVGERKVSGILAEAHITGVNKGSVIVGIGINLSTEDFPDDIKNRAGSLINDVNTGSLPSREEVIGKIAAGFHKEMSDLLDLSYLEEYKKHCIILGKDISYMENDKSCIAHAIDIADDAGLIVKMPDGEIRNLKTGEVSLIRIAN